MGKHARLPAFDRVAEARAAEAPRTPRLRARYYAFLSYSHKDKELADWLHRELERFRVPRALAGKLTANGVVPRRLVPIFRDQHDLAATGDLGGEIKSTLAASQFLVILCSPTAAVSRWTNAEIEWFKQSRPEACVLAAIASGEPFASDIPGREDKECFPPALRHKYDRRGRRTEKRAEPLAADLRGGGESRREGFLRLVAGMLGVGLDELVQREQTRRHRRLAWLAAASLAGMAVTSILSVVAIQSRDEARDQRREAEGLVAYMVGDLRAKLEPIGRLDALDGVGSRVLAYYSKQDASELSDAALTQRSKALSLMAQVADARGDIDGALKLYREAMAGTAETIRRRPDDAQAIFDHAQNVFYIGEIERGRGNLKAAEAEYREYKSLADKMVALAPDNMKWRMEVQNSEANLGIALYQQRRFAEAGAQFAQALHGIQALSTADSRNSEYQKSLADTLAWLADTRLSEGQLEQAIRLRQQHVALLRQHASAERDIEYRQRLVAAERALGNLFGAQGKQDLALAQLSSAVTDAEALLTTEPDNLQWNDFAAKARLNYAEQLFIAGKADESAAQASSGCALAGRLAGRGAAVASWRVDMRDCLLMRARLALHAGQSAIAVQFAQQALARARSIKSSDQVGDRYGVAKSLRISGDARNAAGDLTGAKADWSAAISVLPPSTTERPPEMAEHMAILQRLGRQAELRPLAQRLTEMGYRRLS
jgi:tetratricopeptide (TPR) repeat protein